MALDTNPCHSDIGTCAFFVFAPAEAFLPAPADAFGVRSSLVRVCTAWCGRGRGKASKAPRERGCPGGTTRGGRAQQDAPLAFGARFDKEAHLTTQLPPYCNILDFIPFCEIC
jgi:hypothetical protein